MKRYLTFLTLFICSLTAPAFGQAKIEGYVSNSDGIPIPAVRIVVTPGGQVGTTDSKGHFIINLPNYIQPGIAARITVQKKGWVIYHPMFGKCATQDQNINQEPLSVVIGQKGSPYTYGPKGLSAFIDELKKRVNRQAKTIDAQSSRVDELERQREKYAFLRKYAEEYGITLDKLKAALDEWARIKESDDNLEQARKEYWLGNLGKVTELTGEVGPVFIAKLKNSNKQRLEDSRKLILTYILEGLAFYEQSKFRESIASLNVLEHLFETRELSKENFAEDWAEVKLSIGNAKINLVMKGERDEGPLLEEALTAYRQAETFYTREQSPQDWALVQNNLGDVLSDLSERVEGADSIKYLNDAVTAYRAALEVRTRELSPRRWARTQNNLGFVLNQLGERVKGADRDKYLREAAIAYRAALAVRTREQSPQTWAEIQYNLAIVYLSLKDWAEAREAYENVLRVSDELCKRVSIERRHAPFVDD